ncbi:hypothetical protein L2E82_51630 [Cichorium intybus]|nr:hypothetical protein L2E82_51630 [Cichorium intybus]
MKITALVRTLFSSTISQIKVLQWLEEVCSNLFCCSQEKCYFVMNDLFHFVSEEVTNHLPPPMAATHNDDFQPINSTSPNLLVAEDVLGVEARDNFNSFHLENEEQGDYYTSQEHQHQQKEYEDSEEDYEDEPQVEEPVALIHNHVDYVQEPLHHDTVEYVQEPIPPVEEPVREPVKFTYASIVIKKIMKMDAGEPFNAPVNPIALGIPDYFDVIKTPMDFGSICNNLEKGLKYMNSEDLNNEHDMKDGNISSHGKSSKSGHSRHKVKRYKDDCLCAICIMMRRRLEREQIMNPRNDQIETSDGLVQLKVEGTSVVGSFNGDDTSSSTDNSQNQDANGNMEDKGEEVKMEDNKEVYNTIQSKQQEEKEKEKEKEMTMQKNYENAIGEQCKSGTEKHEDVQMADVGDDDNN